MVAFRKSSGGLTIFEGDLAQTILRQRGLTLGELHVWLEPKQPTDDDLRAASALRLPSIAELALFGTEEEPME